MRDRRYLLVIMDGRGRTLRRLPVARRSIKLAGLGVALAAVAGLAMLGHGLQRRAAASESAVIAEENIELESLLADLQELGAGS